nr:MAG TPA: nucelotide kinase [Caudoviricetes sp.]
MTDKINNYDHPQRYTGEDGKDLIDRMEEGLITEDQTRGFLKGNILKYVVRYEDKGGMDDLIKAHEYLTRLIAFEDGGDSDD